MTAVIAGAASPTRFGKPDELLSQALDPATEGLLAVTAEATKEVGGLGERIVLGGTLVSDRGAERHGESDDQLSACSRDGAPTLERDTVPLLIDCQPDLRLRSGHLFGGEARLWCASVLTVLADHE